MEKRLKNGKKTWKKIKIIPRKVNSALNDCVVIANLKELIRNFVIVPTEKLLIM